MKEIKILIVDDEEKIRIMFDRYLSKQGYKTFTAENGEEALQKFYANDIDLVLLDVMMPIKDGYEVCRELKENSNVAVVMLTAKDDDNDELFGLKCGADDYISKLSSLKVVSARIELILKRLNIINKDYIEYGGININLTTHILTIDGKEKDISLKEFELLTYFMKNKGKALTRESLLKNVWNYDYYEDSRTLDTHIKKLRKRLGKDKDYIKTIWGIGYKFEVD
ncbi:response regulator transcription factor [Thomasclavelia cocleata]|uniref:response regulator transcription factor n=1 Tax=Thomasclavelia cocleata TaxID=69824 RepID=UPI00256EBC60|nr:response regulator transcription factor [Thomasclavelia cocleata]